MIHEIEFREKYVTSGEICRRVNITSAALSLAKKAGRFPMPLELGERIDIWLRADVEKLIQQWTEEVLARRSK